MTESNGLSDLDAFGRRLKYLRISITDRCNMRCRYCMPDKGVHDQTHAQTLSYEAYLEIVQVMVGLGVKKVRVTGGEPLVRKGCVSFVKALKALEGLEEVVMTTNGVLLPENAQALKEAGLDRVNISLDALDAPVFNDITRCGLVDPQKGVESVLAGIEAAKHAGLLPIKINMVYMAGINDSQLEKMMALSGSDVQVRLIELMPIGEAASWSKDHFASVDAVLEGHPLLKRVKERDSGVAKNYLHRETGGLVGGITPISDHFCHGCDKVRLTSDGHLKVCLHDDFEVDLKPYLGQNRPDTLKEVIVGAFMQKARGHQLLRDDAKAITRNMVSVGG